jgi:hypothetical protein
MRLALITVVLISLVVAGCGGGDSASQFSQVQAQAAQAERSAGTWRGLAIALLIVGVVAGIVMGSKARRDGS